MARNDCSMNGDCIGPLIKVCSIFFLIGCYSPHVFTQNTIDHYALADRLYEENLRDSALWHVDKIIAQASIQQDDSLLILGLTLKCQIFMAIRTLNEANAIINKALPIANGIPEKDSHLTWQVYRQKAQMMNTMYRFDSTIHYLSYAAANISGPDDNPAYSHSLYAWAYVNKRDYDKAIDHSKQSYELYQAGIDSPSISLILPLQCLQASYNYSSQFDSALIYAKKYQNLVSKFYPRGHPNIGIAHNDLGTIYQNLRQYAQALFHRKKCEEVFYQDYLKNKQTRLISHAWHNLGYLYNQMGDNHLAIIYLKKALSLNEKDYGKENLAHINTLLHLGHLRTIKQEHKPGEYFIRRALRLQHKLGPNDQGAINLILGNLATNLYLQRDFQHSDSLYSEVSKFYHSTNSYFTKQLLSVHDGWGHSWALRNDHREAINHYSIALAIADSIYPPLNLETIGIYSKIARSYAHFDPAKSQIYQDKILQILSTIDEDDPSISTSIPNAVIPELVVTKLVLLEGIQQKGDSIRNALLHLMEEYASYLSRHLGMFSSDVSIQDFSATNKQIFIKASELLLHESKTNEDLYTSFRWGDSFRSLTLKIQANGIITGVQSTDIAKRQREEDSLLAKLRSARIAYHQSPDREVEALRHVANCISEYQSLKEQIRIEDEELYLRKYAITQMAKKFDPSLQIRDRDIIQFSATDSILHVHILNNTGVQYFSSNLALSEGPFLTLLNNENHREELMINKMIIDSLLVKLHAYTTTHKWIIIPDGDLAYLNLEQLKIPSGSYLIEDIEISYAYSLSQLLVRGSDRNVSGSIGSFAPGFSDSLKQNYLHATTNIIDSTFIQYLQQPFMLALAADLQQQFHGYAFLEEEANEHNLKQAIHQFNIINLGTHGEIDDTNPLYSRIVLAKESIDTINEDGYLHTYEIYGLQIPAELAILSACETGSGKIKDGEGVISLAHAFQYAGCPSVIMSLWKIDEKSSAIILKHFYRYLASKWDKSAALRQAKLDYISEVPTKLKAPYYWAGLVLIGDYNPISIDDGRSTKWLLMLGLVVLLGLMGIAVNRKRKRV